MIERNPEICGHCGKEIRNGIGLFICADCAAERMWKKRKGMKETVIKVCDGMEEGITTFVEGKYDPIYLGSSPHDGPMYKCSKCGQVYSSWEWLGKKEFTCNCGATWDVPK